MIYGAKLLALCAMFTGTAAFLQPASKKAATSLASTQYPAGYGGQATEGGRVYDQGRFPNRFNGRYTGAGAGRVGINQRNRYMDGYGGGPNYFNGGMRNRGDVGYGGYSGSRYLQNIWDTLPAVKIQGDALRTWSFTTHRVERVQVFLKSEGRPINANIECWQGPDNTPLRLNVSIEDGNLRPFSAIFETPRETGQSVAIYNTSPMEYPFEAAVEAEVDGYQYAGSSGFNYLSGIVQRLEETSPAKLIQGGAIQTFPFHPAVESVQVLVNTDGRPLNARIELLQGPNNGKQVMELYSEDGLERPFFAIIETPGTGNVVRIVNTAPVEFPLMAAVEAYYIDEYADMDRTNGQLYVVSGED